MSFLGSLLGIMGQIGRLVPNYVDGYRQAWADNWRDANQYNQIQSGQMQNAFASAAFAPELNMLYDRAGISRDQADMSGGNFGLYALAYPYLQQAALMQAQSQPSLTLQAIQSNLYPGLAQGQALLNQEALLNQMGFTGPLGQNQALFNQQMQQPVNPFLNMPQTQNQTPDWQSTWNARTAP